MAETKKIKEMISIVVKESKKIEKVVSQKNKGEKNWPENNSWFWAAKKIDGKYWGYTLYLFGGHALDIYLGYNNHITYRMFSNKYIKDKDGMLQKTRERYKNITWTKREEKMKNGGIKLDDWRNIVNEFRKWGFGIKPYKSRHLERMRECIIANFNDTSINSDVEVFDVESATWVNVSNLVDGGEVEAKPDIMAIRDDGNNKRVCFVEYKCTEEATTSNISFKEHYEKMVKYYDTQDCRSKMWELYKKRRELVSRSVTSTEHCPTESEIVFLISHISSEEKEGYVTAQSLMEKLLETKDYKDNIKIVIYDNECRELLSSDFLSFDEGIKKVKEVINPTTDNNIT